MAEFTYIEDQTVANASNVLLNTVIGCNKGYVIHRNGSGIVTLRGLVNCPNSRFARYRVEFKGNIAVPTGGTVGEIGVAVAISGETLQSSLAVKTPAAVNQYDSVTTFAIIDVPRGCCYNVAIENASSTGEDILVRNALLEVTRIA